MGGAGFLAFLVIASGCAATVRAEPKPASGPVIGIDLGTTYSCVGIYKNGRVQIIANEQGNRITPSYVSFGDSGRLIGDAAKNQASSNPKNTFFDVKRLIGRAFSDKDVQRDRQLLPYDIVDRNGKPHVMAKINGSSRALSPEEVSAMVLGKMKETAEAYLGEPVRDAVVTVPAYFNDAQRQATVDAGTIAGLNVMRIIAEPTAAALAYGLNKKHGRDETNILVYDLGGGTFDVSVLTLDDQVFEVLATNGDTHLGGEDFDQRVMKHFTSMIKRKHGVDISRDDRALAKLRRAVEKAKRALSTVQSTQVEVEGLLDGEDFSETLSRAKFESLNHDLFRGTLGPVRKVLKDAGLRKSEIDEIVLVGGSTRIPKIQELLKEFFNGKALNRGVNPDEAVAHGASVMGGVLGGEDSAESVPVVLDVIPLSLGIETVGGVFTKLMERNLRIPARKSQVFSTNENNQPAVDIQVFQGERAMAKDNINLGRFKLSGIPPAPRGVPQIEVTFEVDANGILTVTALDKATKRTESITVTADKGRLSEDEIAEKVAEAERMAEADRLSRETVEARNKLEGVAYSLRNTVNDVSDGSVGADMSDQDKSTVENAVAEAIEWLDDNPSAEKDELQAALSELEAKTNPIMQKLYQARGGAGSDSAYDEGQEDDAYDTDDEL